MRHDARRVTSLGVVVLLAAGACGTLDPTPMLTPTSSPSAVAPTAAPTPTAAPPPNPTA